MSAFYCVRLPTETYRFLYIKLTPGSLPKLARYILENIYEKVVEEQLVENKKYQKSIINLKKRKKNCQKNVLQYSRFFLIYIYCKWF